MDPSKVLPTGMTAAAMPDPWNLFLSVIFGLIGLAFIAYGKKMTSFPFMICGLSLMVYTFFVTSTTGVLWWGLGFCFAAFLLDRYL